MIASSSAVCSLADVDAGAREQRLRAVVLRQHRRQHVHRLDVGVVARDRQALRVGERLLEGGRQLVESHGGIPPDPAEVGARTGFQGGRPAGTFDSAQEDAPGRGESRAPAQASAPTHMGQRVAEGKHQLAALQQDQRLGRERRERREAAQQAGDDEQPQQLVGRALEPEQDRADAQAADAVDEQRAERKAGPARVQPDARPPSAAASRRPRPAETAPISSQGTLSALRQLAGPVAGVAGGDAPARQRGVVGDAGVDPARALRRLLPSSRTAPASSGSPSGTRRPGTLRRDAPTVTATSTIWSPRLQQRRRGGSRARRGCRSARMRLVDHRLDRRLGHARVVLELHARPRARRRCGRARCRRS